MGFAYTGACKRPRRSYNIRLLFPPPQELGRTTARVRVQTAFDSLPFLGVLIVLTKAHPKDWMHLIGGHKGKGTPGYSHNSASSLPHCAQPRPWSQNRRGS